MPDYNGSITLYVHDSDCCTYLGVCIVDDGPYVGEYDLYTCLQGGYRPPTIIARYGDPGPCYYSGLCFAAEYRNPVLWEGAKRAIALKLLTQEELDKEVGQHVIGSVRFESAGTIENGVATYKVFDMFDVEEEEESVVYLEFDPEDEDEEYVLDEEFRPYFEDYDDFCPECDMAMIWDAGERIYYCVNTWEHG